jgi:N-acetylmuramoyl-L-alanine amidase
MRLISHLAAAILACAAFAVPVDAASARAMYNRALEREQAVRPGLGAERVSAATTGEARKVVKAYERIVTRYPGSGYADNALFQGARLAADLWALTGEEDDRAIAIAMYTRLVNGYNSSSLIGRARPELARLQRTKSPSPAQNAAKDERTSAVPAPPQNTAKDERIIPVPPPATVRVRDVPPLPPPPPPNTTTDAAVTERATIKKITRQVIESTVRVTIELDREVPYHDERIGGPDRVFLDLSGARPVPGIKVRQTFSDGAVRQIRLGARPGNSTRVVLEVDGATRHSVFALYDPYRLVIDCDLPVQPRPTELRVADESAAPLPAIVAARAVRAPHVVSRPAMTPTASARPTAPSSRASRSRSAGVTTASAESKPPLPTRRDESIAEAVTPAPLVNGTPSATLGGGYSLSRQLGLGIARVVIDPGHGGHDPGAQAKELNESDVVLDVALRLEQLLLKQPGVEVVLTRRTDVFVPLEERTAIANKEEADLFLSIHANASRSSKARGVETYFLNFASNPEAQAVAARENAASGRTMHSLPDIVRAITLNDKLDESRDFAMLVQRAMVQRLRAGRDLGVKQAPFVVLIGAGMPSILAEISFVTNPQEARLLRSNDYRQRIAQALFDGVVQYQRAVKNVKTVSNQSEAGSNRR